MQLNFPSMCFFKSVCENEHLKSSLQKLAEYIFFSCKNENSKKKKNDIFNHLAPNIDCWYMLEPPLQGGSNEYPQYMFWEKNNTNRYTPTNPSFFV